MAEQVAASPAAAAATPAAVVAAVATTLATSDEPGAATPAPGDAAAVAAAATAEAERVAKLSPEAKLSEETAAKAKADAKAKEEADAKVETARRAALTPEQRKAEDTAKAEADAKAAKAKEVPEKYELTLPEGLTLDAEVTGEFEKTAKELGLSQENAQKLYDIGAKAMVKNTNGLLTSVAAVQDGWLKAAETDKEFGGENLAKNMSVAKSALKFATPELKKVLNETKLGNHPEMIRWMYRVGLAMAEDTFVTGKGTALTPDGSFDAKAKKLYPNQN